MPRVFLDANVLFSAAYREGAGLLALWQASGVELLTSGYAAEEARRNLDTAERRAGLERLLASVEIVPEAPGAILPAGVRLPEKDEPILRAAIACGATHLLTGDIRDFGRLLGRRAGDLLVQTPGDFLRSR
ncbi:MAG: PIN domain-containing protein [Thermoanaerobaculia bacterium]